MDALFASSIVFFDVFHRHSQRTSIPLSAHEISFSLPNYLRKEFTGIKLFLKRLLPDNEKTLQLDIEFIVLFITRGSKMLTDSFLYVNAKISKLQTIMKLLVNNMWIYIT